MSRKLKNRGRFSRPRQPHTIEVVASQDIEVFVAPIEVIVSTDVENIEAEIDPTQAFAYSSRFWHNH